LKAKLRQAAGKLTNMLPLKERTIYVPQETIRTPPKKSTHLPSQPTAAQTSYIPLQNLACLGKGTTSVVPPNA
jgi:hypothetical protein